MIALHRVIALMRQTFLNNFKGIDPIIDYIYWPLLDICLFGFTGVFAYSNKSTHATLALMTCLVLYRCMYQNHLDIALAFLRELWSKNTLNLFISPLTIQDWIAAALFVGVIDSIIILCIGSLGSYLITGTIIFTVGPMLLLCWMCAVLTGWGLGLTTLALLMTWGSRMEKLVWIVGWFFSPFIGAFYDYTVLPPIAQYIGATMPITAICRAIWGFCSTGIWDTNLLLQGLLHSCLFFAITYMIAYQAFKRSLQHGLARLEDA